MYKSMRFWTGVGVLVWMGIRTGFGGTISGHIKDAVSGNPLPDVEILVEGTHFRAVSGDGGFYVIENLPEGEYTVKARVLGYAPKILEHVQVKGAMTLDFPLDPKPLWMGSSPIPRVCGFHHFTQRPNARTKRSNRSRGT